jgi:hypothetical protein
MSTLPIYYSIESGKKVIRLVILESGCYEDTLMVSLHVSSLLETTRLEYQALSYACGTEKAPHKAVVNGAAMTIGANLDCALRHFRSEKGPVTLWVDALCIYQANLAERHSEV